MNEQIRGVVGIAQVACVIKIHTVVSVLYDSVGGANFCILWEHAMFN